MPDRPHGSGKPQAAVTTPYPHIPYGEMSFPRILRIPAQSDHRIRRKVISDSGGNVITFAVRTAMVQGA